MPLFPVFIVTLVAVIFLASIDRGCLALLTTGCINRNTPSIACCSGDIEISSSVTSIEHNAFAGYGVPPCSITSVIIPDSVTNIGGNAFENNEISSVTIGNSVTTIDGGAFAGNKINSLTIPNSVTRIGYGAFENNEISSVTIGNSVTTIDSGAFAGNKINSLTIPNSVETISYMAFYRNNISSLTLGNSLQKIDNSAFMKNQISSLTLPNSVQSIEYSAFAANKLTYVSIPSTVISVGEKAFFNNRLASYVVESPNTTSIGAYAFAGQFGHLVIPDGVTSIDWGSFYAYNLISVVIPDSVETIEGYAFRNNQISSLTLGSGVKVIGWDAFSKNQISSLTLPNSVQSISDGAFAANKLTYVSIPSNLTSVGDKAFLNNHLTSYVVESSNTTIGAYAFAGQFGHLVIPDGVTGIIDSFFSGYNLISVVIPDSVETINESVFYNNLITSLTLGSGLTTIGSYTFANNMLTTVVIPESVTSLGYMSFSFNDNICLIYLGTNFSSINAVVNSYSVGGGGGGNKETFRQLKEKTAKVSSKFKLEGSYGEYKSGDKNVAYPECDTRITTDTPTPSPTHRPTMRDGRPAKGIKFRGDRGDKNPPAFAAFFNSEETTDRSPDANIEYHCFEHDARYVRGTYGMRGYFEGKLDGHIAYVNFFEITNDGETLVPTTGSAAITYSDDWSSVDGPFWSTGTSTMPGSWGSWGALESCVNCFPSDMSMKRIRKEKCLWSDNEHSHFERLPDLSDRIMGSEQTANTWFNIGYGPRDTSGVMVGSYHYTYTEQQCSDWSYDCSGLGFDEVGRYGSHSVSANVKGGRIFASDLQISSGPLGGHIGSGLYLIFNYEDGSVGYTGYFCAADWIVDDSSAQTSTTSGSSSSSGMGSGNMKLVLVDCAYDAGDEMAADSDQAVHLLGAGYDNMWNIYSDEWQRLSRFFQLSTISTTTN